LLLAVVLAIAASALGGLTLATAATRPTPAPAAENKPEPPPSVPFENVEGIILVRATASAFGRDTTGPFALDTGAGFLALDAELASILGVAPDADPSSIGMASHPLGRLQIGSMQFDQVQPILTIDGKVVRQVAERPVLGLLGAQLMRNLAVVVDYRAGRATFLAVPRAATGDTAGADSSGTRTSAASDTTDEARIKRSRLALASALGAPAQPLPFRLAGDGKIVVRVRLSDAAGALGDTLTLLVDTGATKTALFAHALVDRRPDPDKWPSLRGLSAPTLMGSPDARLARIKTLAVGLPPHVVRGSQVDVGVLDSPLEQALSDEVEEPVAGLLGYSFLRRFRFTIDYPNRVLWLEPVPHGYDDRAYEYSHVGLQIERRGTTLRAVGVAVGSPADRAGIERDDELVAIDGTAASELDAIRAARRLEGPPGTAVRLTMRRGSAERTYRLIRKRLL
jgi:hypothetical protein